MKAGPKHALTMHLFEVEGEEEMLIKKMWLIWF